MKIVFLTSSYYPYFSAIGKCVNNIVNELKNDNEIIVISNMPINNSDITSDFDNHKIIKVRTKSMVKRDILLFKKNEHIYTKLITKVKLFFLRLNGYLNIILSKVTIDKSLVNEYYISLTKFEYIDLIIPTCYPFEAVMAALKYKHTINQSVKVIPFLFDKFSDSPTLHRNKYNKLLKYKNNLILEEKMIKNSFKVLYVDSWTLKMETYFAQHKDKLIHVEHPLIVDYFDEPVICNEVDNANLINITYTGVLDKEVRPPTTTLDIIAKMIEKDKRLIFHFYVLGNAAHEVNYYSKKYPGNIINYGYVESNVATTKIKQSNILLSIGNTDITLIPSKIFEYMSSGKPIIHFYNSDEDRVNSMLNDYKLGYCVNQNKEISDSELELLLEFCISKKNSRESFEEVQKIFYKATPKHISNIILKEGKEIDGKHKYVNKGKR